jgi:hypothetical protein
MKSHYFPSKCGKTQIFANDSNTSEIWSLFATIQFRSFVFSTAQEYGDEKPNCNCASSRILCRRKKWSPTLISEIEWGYLRKSFATNGRMEEEARENCIVRNFAICIVLQILLRCEEEGMGGVGSTHWKGNEYTLGSGTDIWRTQITRRRNFRRKFNSTMEYEKICWEVMDWIFLCYKIRT